MNIHDRVAFVRHSISEMRLGRDSVPARLMSEAVPLDWNMACDAAEEIMALREMLKAMDRRTRTMERELQRRWGND